MKRRSNIILVLLTVSLILPEFTLGQKGYPFISDYSFNEVIDRDNFDIIEDDSHNILLANRKGIIIFDSRQWELIPLKNFPLCLEKDPENGRIFVGCKQGFGQLQKDEAGRYKYIELSPSDSTGEIITIQIFQNKLAFITEHSIYILSRKSLQYITKISSENYFTGSFISNDTLYCWNQNAELFKYNNDTLQLIKQHFAEQEEMVFSTETDSLKTIIGLTNNQLYLFNNGNLEKIILKDQQYLNEGILNNGLLYKKGKLALGTLLGGVILLDFQTGETEEIINFQTGLPEDEVFCIQSDSNKGIWIAHQYGLSRIDLNIPIRNYSWYPGLTGEMIDMISFDKKIFLATWNGLFQLQEVKDFEEKIVLIKTEKKAPATTEPLKEEALSNKELRRLRRQERKESNETQDSTPEKEKNSGFISKIVQTIEKPAELLSVFNRNREEDTPEYDYRKKKIYKLQSISHQYVKIEGVKGRIRDLFIVSDHLIIITNSAVYSYKDKLENILSNHYISFAESSAKENMFMIKSNNEISVYSFKDTKWELLTKFPALKDMSSMVLSDNKAYFGSDNSISRFNFDSDFNFSDSSYFTLPGEFMDQVFLDILNDSIYALCSSGIYQLNNDSLQIIRQFNSLQNFPVYYFGEKSLWYQSNHAWNRIPEVSLYRSNLLKLFNKVKAVQDFNSNETWLINNNQIYQIKESYDPGEEEIFNVYFSRISGKEKIPYPLSLPEIDYSNSSLKISFSAPYYLSPSNTEYSYRILEINDKWSDWTINASIEYPVLPPGEYNFQVMARNLIGQHSEIQTLHFKIKPPFWQTTVFFILLGIVILILFILIIHFREANLQKAKRILENKVKIRTQEIEEQKNEIAEQKKSITDSIEYARKIQSAAIPSPLKMKELLPEHFVLFKPRDIVSGDFYWIGEVQSTIILVAADCTGHGVPGAFMSMLGISFLNEIVNRQELTSASEILNALRRLVKDTISKEGEEERRSDGMDISLCMIDKKKNILQYAGAFNPLYLIRDNELTIIKGDKMPIGMFTRETSFTNHVINIQKSDCFYISSDGFIDQFGGADCKKYLSKNFKSFLLKIHQQPMSKQLEMLKNEFNTWKGPFSQLDDVLVIGFRV